MDKANEVLKSMSLEFFGKGKHKISPSNHFAQKNAVFLDVRSKEEHETISFNLIYHMPVLHIPICEIPERFNEIPRDKFVGIFCSTGTRAAMVYLYLRSLGYENVRVLEGGYNGLSEEFKPGKLLKHLSKKEDKK